MALGVENCLALSLQSSLASIEEVGNGPSRRPAQRSKRAKGMK